MIEKQRLEELIKQGATIYKVVDNKVYQLRQDHLKYWIVKEDRIEWYTKIVPSGAEYILFNHLFETKEEAEWHREFGCIERTERLELPTWEDLKNCLNRFCYFTDCCGREYCLSYTRATNKLRLRYFVDELDEEEWGVWELTKENYIHACRKAKELFLGNNDQNAT